MPEDARLRRRRKVTSRATADGVDNLRAIFAGRRDNDGYVGKLLDQSSQSREVFHPGHACIEQHKVEAIYFLGDVVGYGPNPRECVDLVMSCRIVLLGNHDQGAMFDPEGFNPSAERAIFWTRAQLEALARYFGMEPAR